MISVDLPDPETPVTQVKQRQWNIHIHIAQIVAAGAEDAQIAVGNARRAHLRHLDGPRPAQVLTRERGGIAFDLIGVPLATI